MRVVQEDFSLLSVLRATNSARSSVESPLWEGYLWSSESVAYQGRVMC